MNTATIEASTTDAPVLRRHKLDVYDLERMVQACILDENARVELIDGSLLDLHPIGSEHSGQVSRLVRLLVMALHERAVLAVHGLVRLSEHSQPQPDVLVLRLRDDDYCNSHPQPEDVLLAIELSQSSAVYDRNVKGPLYSRAGIAEYWIVDLDARMVVVCRDPRPEGYRDITEHGPDATIAPLKAPDVNIELRPLIA